MLRVAPLTILPPLIETAVVVSYVFDEAKTPKTSNDFGVILAVVVVNEFCKT